LYDRSLEKTPDQVFINSLPKEYELLPAEGAGILKLAKVCIFGQLPATIGQLRLLCTSRKSRHGKPLSKQYLVRVTCSYLLFRDDLNKTLFLYVFLLSFNDISHELT